jgi:hypothetical protein
MSSLGFDLQQLRRSLRHARTVDNESSRFAYSHKPLAGCPLSQYNKLSPWIVVSAIHFISDDGKTGLRRRQRIGFPREVYGWYFNLGLKLCCRAIAFHPEFFLWIIISDFFIRPLPNHSETHNGWCADGIKGGPLRLINHRNVLHLERCGAPVRANDKASLRNWNDPIQARRRNWRMKIVNLILRSSLPLK